MSTTTQKLCTISDQHSIQTVLNYKGVKAEEKKKHFKFTFLNFRNKHNLTKLINTGNVFKYLFLICFIIITPFVQNLTHFDFCLTEMLIETKFC